MILTVVILAAVTAILASALASERERFRAAYARVETAKARRAALSGLHYALASLQTIDPSSVTKLDDWYEVGSQAEDRHLVGEGSFRLQVVDASSLVNLNTATEDQLSNLGLTTEQIDSLLDWREEGNMPRTEGAKDEFYNTLTYPYNAKLRRLDSLDELLLVKGFDPSTLLQSLEQTGTSGYTLRPLYSLCTVDSFSPNTGPSGAQKANINSASVEQLVQAGLPPQVAAAVIALRNSQGPFQSLGAALRAPGMNADSAAALVDGFMVGAQPRTEGRINVNTATEEVLATMPEITSDVAQSIVSQQSAGFQSLGALLQVPGFTLETLQATVDRLTISSETFLVRIEGRAGSIRYPLEVVVRANGGAVRVVKTLDPPKSDMRELWGWADDPTNDVDLGETQ